MAEYFGAKVEDVFNTMPERFNPKGVSGVDVTIGYDIKGDGGGKWLVTIKDEQLKVESVSDLPKCTVTMTADAEAFVGGALGVVDTNEALGAGKLKVAGDLTVLGNVLPKAFSKFVVEGMEVAQGEELIVLKCLPSIDQRFSTGPYMGKWYAGLKEKKIIASICPVCGRTQIPTREVCPKCTALCTEFREVGPKATVILIDKAYYASPDPLTGKIRKTPYATLFLVMDGSTPDESFSADLADKDFKRIQPGMRVRPVWNEVRTGSFRDLLYFEIDD